MSDITRKKKKKASRRGLKIISCRGAQPLQLQDPPEKEASDKMKRFIPSDSQTV